nr:hypothetical protein [Streptomyces virginiae]
MRMLQLPDRLLRRHPFLHESDSRVLALSMAEIRAQGVSVALKGDEVGAELAQVVNDFSEGEGKGQLSPFNGLAERERRADPDVMTSDRYRVASATL